MCVLLEKMLAEHASQAIFGIKSSNLISFPLNKIYLLEEFAEVEQRLGDRLKFRILKRNGRNALVLVYRPAKLFKTIFSSSTFGYLMNHGYPKDKSLDKYLSYLEKRIAESDSFPHEIGVFLGYDLYDTIQFERKNKNSLCCGYWKVYRDKEIKLETFERYNKCKSLVNNLLNKGYSLEKIINKEY